MAEDLAIVGGIMTAWGKGEFEPGPNFEALFNKYFNPDSEIVRDGDNGDAAFIRTYTGHQGFALWLKLLASCTPLVFEPQMSSAAPGLVLMTINAKFQNKITGSTYASQVCVTWSIKDGKCMQQRFFGFEPEMWRCFNSHLSKY